MATSTILTKAAEKRRRIAAWMKTAISKTTAESRGLVQLSKCTATRNWICREALYDFARQAAVQTKPVLVNVDSRRAALYFLPPKPADPA